MNRKQLCIQKQAQLFICVDHRPFIAHLQAPHTGRAGILFNQKHVFCCTVAVLRTSSVGATDEVVLHIRGELQTQ